MQKHSSDKERNTPSNEDNEPTEQTAGAAFTPTDARMRARALARWEGEGGTLGVGSSPGDVLDESELRILARIGAAALAQWADLAAPLKETMLGRICQPLVPGDGARAKAAIAKFLEETAHR